MNGWPTQDEISVALFLVRQHENLGSVLAIASITEVIE
jgi:hypothetical protein